MKIDDVKRIFTAAALALILAVVVHPASAAAGETPQVVVREASHDFGSVYDGRIVIHGFTLKNTGDAPLSVEDVRTG